MAKDPAQSSIRSLLDNDLYKINMQATVFQHFPTLKVEYAFTNRSPNMRLNKQAAAWLQQQVLNLGDLRFSQDELAYLQKECWYLKPAFLEYLAHFQLRPAEHVTITCHPVGDGDGVDIDIRIAGLWLETIPYEIPLLALVSEAYFRFVDRDWDYSGQAEQAHDKAIRLLSTGCAFSDFGTRRRRDFKTQDIVVEALVRAAKEKSDLTGELCGTSNVYFAKKHGIPAIGTVAHEWIMCIAAIHDDYAGANERALQYWLDTWGPGVLGIALTDTFGSPAFFKAFSKPLAANANAKTYAEVFQGVRQDSGHPPDFVKMAAKFYEATGITGKSIIFSDSLDVDKCIEYKVIAEEHGLKPSFGVGTHFTNDFQKKSDPSKKSKPMNIVIKVSRADGKPCIKLSDDPGKHTGDSSVLEKVISAVATVA